MKYILYTIIESDNNIGHKSHWYDTKTLTSYETEAIQCFDAWRNLKSNHLKDIQIICVNPTSQNISNKTLKIFKELNIDYRWDYDKYTDGFKCRYYNVPYIGSKLESEFNNDDILIHIDLDMILLQKIRDEILILNKYEAIVGAYDNDNNFDKRSFKVYDKLNVTCWIVSRGGYGQFYSKWWAKLKSVSRYINPENNWREYCDLEEHVVDLLKYQDGLNLKYVDEFMLGVGYTDIQKHPELANKIVFLHAHEFQNRSKYYKQFLKKGV